MQNDSTKNPTPAPGQIWRTHAGEIVITHVGHGLVCWDRGGHCAVHFLQHRGECIGVETPAGRVMVGERRHMAETPRTVHEIVRVQDADVVTYIRGGSEARWPAKTVARWPLACTAPDTPAKPAPSRAPSEWDRVSIGGLEMPPQRTVTLPGYVDTVTATIGFTDPRAEREQRRREIDAVLAEDACMFPEFATARRAAVMAAYEMQTNLHHDAAPDLLTMLRGYEDARGASRTPWERAADPIVGWGRRNGTEAAATVMVAAYERARGLP